MCVKFQLYTAFKSVFFGGGKWGFLRLGALLGLPRIPQIPVCGTILILYKNAPKKGEMIWGGRNDLGDLPLYIAQKFETYHSSPHSSTPNPVNRPQHCQKHYPQSKTKQKFTTALKIELFGPSAKTPGDPEFRGRGAGRGGGSVTPPP